MRDTIDMAREAELDELLEQMPRIAKKFKAFEALVRADERTECAEHYLGIMRNAIKEAVQAEREACIAIAESKRHSPNFQLTSMPPQNGTAVDIANAIRAREETK